MSSMLGLSLLIPVCIIPTHLLALAAKPPPIPPPTDANTTTITNATTNTTLPRRNPHIVLFLVSELPSPAILDCFSVFRRENPFKLLSSSLSAVDPDRSTGEWWTGGGISSFGWRRSLWERDRCGPDIASGASMKGFRNRKSLPVDKLQYVIDLLKCKSFRLMLPARDHAPKSWFDHDFMFDRVQ